MKSQDIILLFKLISLEKREKQPHKMHKLYSRYKDDIYCDLLAFKCEMNIEKAKIYDCKKEVLNTISSSQNITDGSAGRCSYCIDDKLSSFISDSIEREQSREELYSTRALEQETGISKSQISLSINRCIEIGLAIRERKNGFLRANRKELLSFIYYGIKYVFPVKPGQLTRGISTSFDAPILKGKLMSAGENKLVWPDAKGKTKGLSVEPLHKSCTYAATRDPEMHALLALTDAIRLGAPRERELAYKMLEKELRID
ncbi:hypothetical protein [Oceanospirillum sediminis]|uniref:Uncharacterized protein n=1 Tax=Oceanospirillum sediminis TaxID=2760088 RepID=A0A839IRJ9_9GAMM|nr:hypothetical protein [Oceanospirillum sediminis]MBB1487541.1 hypothetical protein [Oceanospirillum sediminis]